MTDVNLRDEIALETDKSMQVIETFPTYREAEAAVDYLSDNGFSVENVRIVGRGLHLVEQVTGRVDNKGAALREAGTGAILGAVFGWMFGMFDWVDPLLAGALLALYGSIYGAIFGALIGWLFHWALRGRRDFSSVGALMADHYDVSVPSDLAQRAIDLLKQRGQLRTFGVTTSSD